MNVIPVGPASPVATGELMTPKPTIQPVAGGLAQAPNPVGTSAPSIQGLAQNLFQQNLQAAILYPVSEPVSGSAGLAQDAMAALLAALNPAQASVAATSVATPPASLDNAQNPTPSASTAPISSATPSTAPSSAPPTVSTQDLPTSQDGFWTSLSPEFAMQTALRFGAGVAVQSAPTVLSGTTPGTGMVRDATAVLRLGNLQTQGGSQGPEAFANTRTSNQQLLQTYGTVSAVIAAQGPRSVDVLA